jgi:hypothetical protein
METLMPGAPARRAQRGGAERKQAAAGALRNGKQKAWGSGKGSGKCKISRSIAKRASSFHEISGKAAAS